MRNPEAIATYPAFPKTERIDALRSIKLCFHARKKAEADVVFGLLTLLVPPPRESNAVVVTCRPNVFSFQEASALEAVVADLDAVHVLEILLRTDVAALVSDDDVAVVTDAVVLPELLADMGRLASFQEYRGLAVVGGEVCPAGPFLRTTRYEPAASLRLAW